MITLLLGGGRVAGMMSANCQSAKTYQYAGTYK